MESQIPIMPDRPGDAKEKQQALQWGICKKMEGKVFEVSSF